MNGEPNEKMVTATESLVVVVLTIGYLGLTTYSLVKWNAEASTGLIVGFTGLATQLVRGYFDQKKLDTGVAAVGPGGVVVDKPVVQPTNVLVPAGTTQVIKR